MAAYLVVVRKLEKRFLGVGLHHIPRSENKEADELARKASRRKPQVPGIFKEQLLIPTATTTSPNAIFTGTLPKGLP